MPQAGLMKQEIRGFLGVNLRTERVDLADEELAKSINADLHTQPGTIVLRLGRTKQFQTELADTIIRRLSKINTKRYQVAGNALYRDQVSILTGLSNNLITTLLPFRPLNDTTTWAFIADDALMRKDNGTNTRIWGIAVPTATPTVAAGAAGNLTGSYKVKFTYSRVVGSSVAHESNPSPESAAQSLTSQQLTITGLTASTDTQVTHKRIYRTVAGGSVFLFDQQITNATLTATSTVADSALGSAVETNNDLPPEASWIASHQEHLFLCRDADNPHYLWFSKRFRPESVPAANFIEIGNPDDPLQCAIATSGGLGVFSRLTKYRIVGNATSGFVHQESLSRRGTPAPLAAVGTEQGVIFVARDGIFLTNFLSPDSQFGDPILPLFFGQSVNGMSAINWDAASTMCGVTYKERYYFSYPSGTATQPDVVAVFSNHTKKWYHYQYPTGIRSFFLEEDTDELTGGSPDRFVYILEDGSTDGGTNISLDLETKDYSGNEPTVRKLFRAFRIDADADTDTLPVRFYVDGTLKRSVNVTGSRTRLLLQLPQETMGYTWRVAFPYSGSRRPRIYGAAALWLPLGSS